MLKIAVVLTFILSVTHGRRSPNAGEVEKNFKVSLDSRYSNNIIEDATLDAPDLVAKYEYPIEIHNVITEDGYILEAHRIPFGRDNNNQPSSDKKIAFIVHGFLSSSADYIVNGPGHALAYLLAEEGYDVWLGNCRGNYYSRRHTSYDPDQDIDFWKFSFEHMGYYDVKAYVDYILQLTGQSKLHYIGHSQGGTTFIALNSLRPEYNEKFISFQGLGIASYFNDTQNPLYGPYSQFADTIDALLFTFNRPELFPNSEIRTWIGINFCTDSSAFLPICMRLFAQNTDLDYYNTTMLPLLMGHNPAGSSIRQGTHFAQIMRSGEIRRFDYGPLGNLAKYGSSFAPVLDLSLVTVPTYLHYSLGDTDATPADMYRAAEKLGNLIGLYQVPRESFHHYDFHWGVDAKEMVFDKMFQLMKEAEESM